MRPPPFFPWLLLRSVHDLTPSAYYVSEVMNYATEGRGGGGERIRERREVRVSRV